MQYFIHLKFYLYSVQRPPVDIKTVMDSRCNTATHTDTGYKFICEHFQLILHANQTKTLWILNLVKNLNCLGWSVFVSITCGVFWFSQQYSIYNTRALGTRCCEKIKNGSITKVYQEKFVLSLKTKQKKEMRIM